MPSRASTQIQWGGADSVVLNSNNASLSDAFTFDAADVAAVLQISCDNSSGSPASGDTLTVRLLFSAGDLLGDGADDYDSVEHSEQYLLDTYATNFPGEDPAVLTIPLNHKIAAKSMKLSVVWNSGAAATRTATVRAMVSALRAS